MIWNYIISILCPLVDVGEIDLERSVSKENEKFNRKTTDFITI